MNPTRRRLCAFGLVSVAGCVSRPGPSCAGATVRLSLRSIRAAESPLSLDPDVLSEEAIAVVETAIADVHVERCVSWDPSANETGASPGLAEIGRRVESHADVELASDRPLEIDVDARFRGDAYALSFVSEPRGGRGSR